LSVSHFVLSIFVRPHKDIRFPLCHFVYTLSPSYFYSLSLSFFFLLFLSLSLSRFFSLISLSHTFSLLSLLLLSFSLTYSLSHFLTLKVMRFPKYQALVNVDQSARLTWEPWSQFLPPPKGAVSADKGVFVARAWSGQRNQVVDQRIELR